MLDDILAVSAPWRIDNSTEIVLTVRDKSLLGSRRYRLRFDLYPHHGASHPERHYGYWDVPLTLVRHEKTNLFIKNDKLYIKETWNPFGLRLAWKGKIPLAGTCILTISLLDLDSTPARNVLEISSQHLFSSKKGDLPLLRASLHVTGKCNMTCDGCYRNLFRSRKGAHTKPDVIEAVLEAAPNLWAVLIHADGEPLLNPEVPGIVNRLRRSMPADGKVGTLTNGMLLDQKKAKQLIDSGINWIQVSFDGATKATMERIRRGSRLDRIIRNVENAVEYGKKTRPGELVFTIHCTLRKNNVRELPDLVRLGAGMGVDHVCLGHLLDHERGEFRVVRPDVLGPIYEECRSAARKHGIRLAGMPVTPLDPPHCHFVEEVFVHVSGDVSPCCFRRPEDPEKLAQVLGNVRRQPLLEIWNGSEYRKLRSRLMANDFQGECMRCPIPYWGASVPV